MYKRDLKKMSWTILACAIFAWCCAGLLLWHINKTESSYITLAQQSQNSIGQQQNSATAHFAVQRSSTEASQLNTALAVDPVDFATLLQSIGQVSGASVQISDAVPESIPGSSASATLQQIYEYGFSVQVEGSFSADMHALQLLQALPAPSSVQEVDLAYVQASGKIPASWQMSVQVQLVTTDNISS